MNTDLFDYVLPEELIAQDPILERDKSRLLVLHKQTGAIEHRLFSDLVEYLNEGDLIVLNDARVTARRLLGHKSTDVKVEALLLKPLGNNSYEALVKPGRRLKPGAWIEFDDGIRAQVGTSTPFGGRILQFEGNGSVEDRIANAGLVPLPPYIHKQLLDPERYQTVYSQTGGSAAAPTAGLHFTSELLDSIRLKGIGIAKITLDVSLDTFRPVRTDTLEEHPMHGEHYTISPETAEIIRECKGRIIAIGTTAVRALEASAIGKRNVQSGDAFTRIFITPGYEFQVIDGMVTNFHLPRTTMLAMVSALSGRENLFHAYREAVQERYRFLSFGDAMLIVP
jgi:S-adenosylmethionine:tRNA ribosyltransferase-isomerase